ncbi:MAG: hypothetical protein PHI11_04530 [Gallionella sp.]|nr:hypothetical protein [Gallionella sp.]
MTEENVIPKSRYKLRKNNFGEKETYSHSQYLVEVSATGEILATDTQLTYNGGLAERFLAMFSDARGGNVAWCHNRNYPEMRKESLVNSTLKH